jgi:sugar/nucleoside kinase (ribokinase family)
MMVLAPNMERGFTCAIGIGGIGAGIVYALKGDHDLGRNESRLGDLLDARDYCKLHIVQHYIARLMGCGKGATSFQVWPVGVVGNDTIGRQLLSEMAIAGIDTQFVRTDPERRTLFSVCFVYPDGSGGNITNSNSAAAALNAEDLKAVSPCMKLAGLRGVALSLPEVPLELRQNFLRLATQCGNYRVCSFVLGEIEEAQRLGLLALTDLLAVNREEASALLGSVLGRSLDETLLNECAVALTSIRRELRMVLTIGERGAYGFERGAWQFCPAPPLQVVSTAGAGDALLAGVVSGLAAGLPFIVPEKTVGSFAGRSLQTALDIGVLNASFSVISPHTIHPDAELKNLFAFAQSHGAFISDAVRSVCRDQRQFSSPYERFSHSV